MRLISNLVHSQLAGTRIEIEPVVPNSTTFHSWVPNSDLAFLLPDIKEFADAISKTKQISFMIYL